MAKLKAHEVDGFLSRTATGYRIYLVYGPDRGLVSERAQTIAKAAKVPLDDPFAVIKLDGSTVNSDPARLLDECLTVSMFGGDRLVWVKDAGNERGLVEAVKTVSKAPLEGVTLIIEADDLKPSSGLRSTCESADTIMALPCYSDDAKAVDVLIDRELAKENLTIALDARTLLKASLGGDRLATRGELEKLALYCRGQNQVSKDDVIAAIGDVSENSADELVDAMLGGDPAKQTNISVSSPRAAPTCKRYSPRSPGNFPTFWNSATAWSAIIVLQRQPLPPPSRRYSSRARRWWNGFFPVPMPKHSCPISARYRQRCLKAARMRLSPMPSSTARFWRSPPSRAVCGKDANHEGIVTPFCTAGRAMKAS